MSEQETPDGKGQPNYDFTMDLTDGDGEPPYELIIGGARLLLPRSFGPIAMVDGFGINMETGELVNPNTDANVEMPAPATE